MAQRGAKEVIGIDSVDQKLALAARNAKELGLCDHVRSSKSLDEPGDIVRSMDAFEHFTDPAAIFPPCAMQSTMRAKRGSPLLHIVPPYRWSSL